MSLIWIVVFSYLGICLMLFLFQPNFIYFPIKEVRATPEIIGLNFDDVTFPTSDGLELSGWFIPAVPDPPSAQAGKEDTTTGDPTVTGAGAGRGEDRLVVILCHGNAGNISHRLDTMHLFHRLGHDFFLFDYRGYGKSQGKPSEKGTYLDAEAAWDYLTRERGIDPGRIVLFGRSLGGSIAAHLAQSRSPQALIVESSFTSVTDMGADIYPFLPVRLLARFKYSTADYLKKVTCPVLISHSKDDEMISVKHGRKLFEAANDPKEFLEFAGSHNEGFIASKEMYSKGIAEFINRAGNSISQE